MTKYVYLFTEGNADMRNLLGGKGANLAEMTNIGLPVPQGFTILLKLVLSTMKMDVQLMMKFKVKLMNTLLRWKKLQERNLETKKIHY